jgi:hypothetical protein
MIAVVVKRWFQPEIGVAAWNCPVEPAAGKRKAMGVPARSAAPDGSYDMWRLERANA